MYINTCIIYKFYNIFMNFRCADGNNYTDINYIDSITDFLVP